MQPVSVVGLGSSPRRGATSDALLQRFLDGASASGARSTKISLSEQAISPCRACGGCDETIRCVIRDGMDTVHDAVEASDVVVLATPVYFGGISATLKAAVDRFQPEWVRKYVLMRPRTGPRRKGYLILTADRDKSEYLSGACLIVRTLFMTLDIDYEGDIFFARRAVHGAPIEPVPQYRLDQAYEMGSLAVQRST